MRSARRLRNQNDVFAHNAGREKGFLYLRDWRLKLCASYSYHVTSFVNCVLNGETFSLTPITSPRHYHIMHERCRRRGLISYIMCVRTLPAKLYPVSGVKEISSLNAHTIRKHIHVQTCSVSTREHMLCMCVCV